MYIAWTVSSAVLLRPPPLSLSPPAPSLSRSLPRSFSVFIFLFIYLSPRKPTCREGALGHLTLISICGRWALKKETSLPNVRMTRVPRGDSFGKHLIYTNFIPRPTQRRNLDLTRSYFVKTKRVRARSTMNERVRSSSYTAIQVHCPYFHWGTVARGIEEKPERACNFPLRNRLVITCQTSR